MSKTISYQRTIYACFFAYIVQAIVNNFAPLLFLTFQKSYAIPLSQITMLVTFNFVVQLLVDLLSASFVDRIGYRASIVLAHIFAGAGLFSLGVLPELLPSPFAGLLISVTIYAIGGGLIEVLVSPIMEACPTENKEKAMSLLHSFYCWGQVGVVLLSTLYFQTAGVSRWHFLAFIWGTLTLCNALFFLRAPLAPLVQDGEKGLSLRELMKNRLFWVFLLMMLCSGASEMSVSQWASTFAEKGLSVSKTLGDLFGPMMFAVLMGLSRAFYGKFGDRIDLNRFMKLSALLCVASYLCVALSPFPALSLFGCALCGLSVGIMWPGTFSQAASCLKNGGTAMFAFLALAGDLGCSAGPTLVGVISGFFGDNLKAGIGAAVFLPSILLALLFLLPLSTDAKQKQ